MTKIFKITFYFFIILTSISACQSVKEGLTGQKKSNSDEFLIEKKNPLVLPPDFDNLPEPNISVKDIKKDNSEIDLRAIIIGDETEEKKEVESKISDSSIEKSILEKIKSN